MLVSQKIMNVKPGDLIKISHGYAKSGLDNKAIINLGAKGIIEKSRNNNDIKFRNSLTRFYFKNNR